MWNIEERNLLKLILQELIPASEDGKVPSAGLTNVINYLEKKAKEELSIKKLFNVGISRVKNFVISTEKDINSINSKDTILFLKIIENEEPFFFKELLKHTYMGYYSEPSVRPYFGVSSNPPHPMGYEVPLEESNFLESLVEPVKKRGICYRKC